MGEREIVGKLEDAVFIGHCVLNQTENELELLIQDIEKAPFLSKAVITQRLFEIKQSLDVNHYLVA
jgi:hypothetical protein